ncbi:unnamed protein product [Protopolystoma xenopodis]|uniref:Uncharacterized protein n=1 Tax=Protopolystoma xenopodis TaxID=117903 RepID=A0A448X9W0_9PLAT|nr:unnamed protein product [Protopolystoma xenopodis]
MPMSSFMYRQPATSPQPLCPTLLLPEPSVPSSPGASTLSTCTFFSHSHHPKTARMGEKGLSSTAALPSGRHWKAPISTGPVHSRAVAISRYTSQSTGLCRLPYLLHRLLYRPPWMGSGGLSIISLPCTEQRCTHDHRTPEPIARQPGTGTCANN